MLRVVGGALPIQLHNLLFLVHYSKVHQRFKILHGSLTVIHLVDVALIIIEFSVFKIVSIVVIHIITV